jgi:hypothetical protein
MRRCLREKQLVLLHEGEGRLADRNHLETCPRCAARYLRLDDDLRVIGQVLDSEPVPALGPGRVVWQRWVLAASVTFALAIGLNVLFAREWGRVTSRQSPGSADSAAATTEELIAGVEAMSAEVAPTIEAEETPALDERGSSTVEASVAELYATVAGEVACESPASLLEDGCGQAPVPGDALGAGFADLDS